MGRPQNYTPAPPMSDGMGDDIVTELVAMVRREIEPLLPRMGTVTSISGEHAQVSVQRWDEDAGGQQFRARIAGTNFRAGDQVLLVPIGGGEYVVVGSIANSNAQRAVIGTAEIEANAVRRQHIANGEVTAAKLDQDYTTSAEAGTIANQQAGAVFTNRITPYSTTAYVDQLNAQMTTAVQARVTQARHDIDLAGKANTVHAHYANQMVTDSGDNMQTVVIALKNLAICTYDKRNQGGNPCSNQRSQVTKIA